VTRAVVHNINFHGIGEPPRELEPGEEQVWLPLQRFLATLDALHGRDDVRLSFDDSNRSDVDVALPALLERRMTATFFVLAGRLDDPHHLGVEDLRQLAESGMRIGSHGLHHRDWRRCGSDELQAELVDSRRILEAVLGRAVTHAAIPFGSYDRRVVHRARRTAGYDRLFTSDGGPADDGAWLQPRMTVCDDGIAPATLIQRSQAHAHAKRAVKRSVKRWRRPWR
jgi:peptidoglycan/xylan/chitin deacetylase (PgdA/CDA1 family)